MTDDRWLTRGGGDRPPRREAPDALRLRQPGADPPRARRRAAAPAGTRAATSSASPGTAGARPARSGPEIVVDQAITALDPAGHLAYRGWDVTRAAVDARYEEVAEWLWGTDASARTTTGRADPAGARDRPARCRPRSRRRRRSPTGCASPSPRSRPATRCATTGASRPWPHARARSSPPSSRRCRRSTPRDAPTVDRLAGAPTLDARVATRTDDRVACEALDRALVAARRPRARDVDVRGARRRVDLGRSLPAAPHRPRRPRAVRCTAARRSSSVRLLPRRGRPPTPRRPSGAPARRRSAFPGSVTRSTRVPIPARRCSSTRSRRSRPPRDLWRAASERARRDDERATGRTPTSTSRSVCSRRPCAWSHGAGEAIFAIARSAGWIAHGLEEYQHRLRYRIRATYTGPELVEVASPLRV